MKFDQQLNLFTSIGHLSHLQIAIVLCHGGQLRPQCLLLKISIEIIIIMKSIMIIINPTIKPYPHMTAQLQRCIPLVLRHTNM